MQGIFHAFSTSEIPVCQFIGIPVLPPEAALNYNTSYRTTTRSLDACFLIGLSWYHHKAGAVRRPAFPSWSWAGWVGELCPGLMFPEYSFYRLNSVKVWIEDDDGSLLRFPGGPENLQPFLSSRDYCKNRFVHIEAITFRFSVIYLQRDLILSTVPEGDYKWVASSMGKDGYYAKFPAGKNTFIYAEVYWDQRERDFQQTIGKVFTGILVGQGNDGFILVVQEMEGYAERVGCFQPRRQHRVSYDNDNQISCYS
jgi:hypothetical protein